MRVHLQRKRFDSQLEAHSAAVFLDLAPLGPSADDAQIAVIEDAHGVWLTVAQETAMPVDEVPILAGFERVGARPA